jgi:hypothetical protein
MHATSLHTLVMLVAQAAPGGDFQLPTDKVDVPQLLAPPAQTTPSEPTPASGETVLPKAPPAKVTPVQVAPPPDRTSPLPAAPTTLTAPRKRNFDPSITLPKNDGSRFEPDFSPKVAPVIRAGQRSRTEGADSSRPDADGVISDPVSPVEFSTTDQLERDASPIRFAPVQLLATGPRRTPWDETKKLIKAAVTLPADSSELTGEQTSLGKALSRVSDRNQRIAVIKTYWRLAVATADFNNANNEVLLLANFPKPLDEVEALQLAASATAAAARLSEAKLVLLSTQHELAELMKSSSSVLPLTSDVPFVGSYQPRFEQMFSGRSAPANLRKLAESFPLYLELTNARANSLLSAEVALAKLADSYPGGNVTYNQILDAFQKLRDQRIAFLATVRDYNNAIADYSLNTVNVGLNTDAIVATLIETDSVPSVLVSPSGVRPASGVAPYRTAGQPTPVTQTRQTPTPTSRLVPVRSTDGFVPRQVTPTQGNPVQPRLEPIPANSFYRR